MFGAKYAQISAAFGVQLNGRPRGTKTKIEINKEKFLEFTVGDLEPAWSDLQGRKLSRVEKQVNSVDETTVIKNENKWRNVNPKKLKILIGNQDAIMKCFELEAVDDKKQMVDLETELNDNVDTIEDLLGQIAQIKQEMTTLKSKLTIQSKNNVLAQQKIKRMYEQDIEELKSVIKIKTNEIRILKISKAMKRSKKKPLKVNERDENSVEVSDNSGMDKRVKNRAIKSVMEILKLESNESIKKKKEIIDKIAEKINADDKLNLTTRLENDVGQSIIKFARIMWTYVNNESIKTTLNTLILAAVTFSKSSISQVASLLGVQRQNSLLVTAFTKQKLFNELEITVENLNQYITKKKRVKRKDAMSAELEETASIFWENNCEVSPNMKDVCRHRVDGGPWFEHIKHFQYDTEAELLKKFLDTGEIIGVKNFHACKPWFIYNGPMNTCVCVKCLNIQLIKESVVRNKKILRAPYQIEFARRIIINILRANLMVKRVRINC